MLYALSKNLFYLYDIKIISFIFLLWPFIVDPFTGVHWTMITLSLIKIFHYKFHCKIKILNFDRLSLKSFLLFHLYRKYWSTTPSSEKRQEKWLRFFPFFLARFSNSLDIYIWRLMKNNSTYLSWLRYFFSMWENQSRYLRSNSCSIIMIST